MILVIRIVLATLFSVILMYFFRPELNPAWGVLLAGFLLGIVYIREHFRKKQPTDKSGKSL
ncbi:MAG: hypothetical protein JEZ02_17090 [Desulfatibacillum sp.]|nr:hypothetical protein [Desulfatibacillum sp.]